LQFSKLAWSVQRLAIGVAVVIQQLSAHLLASGSYQSDLAAVADRVVIIFGDLRFGLNLGILGIRHQLEMAAADCTPCTNATSSLYSVVPELTRRSPSVPTDTTTT